MIFVAFFLIVLYNNYRNKENNTNTEKEKVKIMKKMTLKEFKETLKDTQFEYFSLEDILNSLSILCNYLAKEDKRKGLTILSEDEKKDANTIYKRLRSKGYYETK